MADFFGRHLWLARFREFVAADIADGLAYDADDRPELHWWSAG